MARQILDPRTGAPFYFKLKDEVPSTLRHLSKIPMPQDLEAGDLILFSAVNPAPGSKLIVEAQLRQFEYSDAMWHHAAIYTGGMELCESQFGKGVRMASADEYLSNDPMKGHLWRVRRSRHAQAQRRRIADEAMIELGKRYDTRTAMAQGIGMFSNSRMGTGIPSSRAFTCAVLFFYSYLYAMGSVVTTNPFLVPAALSQTEDLDEVPVRWCGLN